MADAENAKPSEDDGALLAVEVSEPVVLQEPDRLTGAEEPVAGSVSVKPEKRQSGLLGFVIGGALLAGAGFGAAKFVFPDTSSDAVAMLQTQFDAQKVEDTALKAALADLSARPTPDAGINDRVATLEAAAKVASDLAVQLNGFEDRLAAIEAASASGEGGPAAALAAMGRDLKALQSRIDAQTDGATGQNADIEAASAAAQARLDATEAAAETAAKQAALSHIRAAFESGSPLGPAVEGLKAMGIDDPALQALSSDAMPTLLSLQDGYAAAARAALDASIRADMGDGWAGRLTSFLRTQSGARSLTPKEGTDPDAVLSRAEAAVREGQINTALTELAGLPPAGSEAMAPWIAEATRRTDTDKAISDLSASLNGQ